MEKQAHSFYLFAMTNGKKKLGYGETPEEAYEVLGYRLTEEEMSMINKDDYIKIMQNVLQQYKNDLG